METPDGSVEERALFLACAITIAVAVIACLPSLGIPLGLAAEGDALDYHLPIVKWIVRHRSYPNWNWTFVDDFPMLGELLMVPFYLVKQEFARLPAILGYFGTAWGTALVGAELAQTTSREAKRELRLFLFTCSLGFQPILVQACHVMLDNIADAFGLFALYFVLRRRAAAAGLAQAAALATRYTLWGSAPGAVLAFLVFHRGQRRWRDLALFIGTASLGAAPILIRNAVLNGNPFYPLLDGLFHGIPFTALDGWGRGNGLVAILLFPLDLFYTNTFELDIFDTRSQPAGFYGYRLGFLAYVQLSVLAIALWRTRGKWRLGPIFQRREVQALAVWWLACFAFWWSGSQILRYFGHGLALLSLAWLVPLGTLVPKFPRALVALATVLSIAAVQSESWKIAFGSEPSFRDSAYVKSAMECVARSGVTPSSVVGFSSRAALNGFFDFDFVFVAPNNMYRLLPGAQPPKPDFILNGYEALTVEGYRPWPETKPCLLKRIGTG